MAVWAVLVLLVAYLIRRGGASGPLLVPIFTILISLFVVYAAGAFGIDIEDIKDLANTGDGGETTTGTTTND
jgi:hypothetical protein